MKKICSRLLFVVLGSMLSCKNEGKKTTHTGLETGYSQPVAGTIIAADSMAITEDQLNHNYFSVKIVSSNAAPGSYNVVAAWGFNTAEGHLTMPKGGENIKPVLKRSAEPYSYLVGFNLKGDTTFYDYFLVNAQRGMISMKYIKAYTFE